MKMIRLAGPSKHLLDVTTILMAAGLIAIFVLLAYEGQFAAFAILLILLTSAWAAVDSVYINLQAYKTWIALHPMILFNAMYLLWFVMLPWYLVIRSRIKAGSVPKKQPGPNNVSRRPRI